MAVTCNLTAYEVSGSTNVMNNTTNVYVKLTATTTGQSHNNNQCPGSITIDGTQHSFSHNIPSNSTVTLYEATHTITHNEDGTKSIQISYSFATGISSGTITGNQGLTLSTVPRTSTVTCSSGTIGSQVTININRASSNFRHTLRCEFYGWHDIVEKTTQTSYQWTIPTSFYGNMGDMQSTWARIFCYTYNGDTLIGESQCQFDIYIPNTSAPSITATIVDTNPTTKALTGNENKLIKYFSNAKIEMNATAKNGATITSKKAICGNQSSTINTTFENVESPIFKFECVDNRGLSTTTTIDKSSTEWVEYTKLYIHPPTLSRPTTTSNTINAELKGNWFNGSFGVTSNILTLKWRSRLRNGSWSSYSTITPTKNENKFSYSGTLGTNFDFQSEYEFEFVVTDKLMTYSINILATQGVPIIDIGKNDVIVNGDGKIAGKFRVGDVLEIVSSMFGVTLSNMKNEKNYFYIHPKYGTNIFDMNEGLYITEDYLMFNGEGVELKGISAYNNPSGIKGTVSFNSGEYSSNYSEVEIIYKDDWGQRRSTGRIDNPNGTTVQLVSHRVDTSSNSAYTKFRLVTINDTSITTNSSGRWNSWNNTIEEGNDIYITKVIFYK